LGRGREQWGVNRMKGKEYFMQLYLGPTSGFTSGEEMKKYRMAAGTLSETIQRAGGGGGVKVRKLEPEGVLKGEEEEMEWPRMKTRGLCIFYYN